MTQPDDIAARLPAPREDEPRELRQDIADELADHLHCAVARERLRDETLRGDNDEALRAALDRFGDPAAVARRLWYDAMKERIMTQRARLLFSAAGGALIALCLMFMWQMITHFQTMQATLADLQRQIAETNVAAIKPVGVESAKSIAEQPFSVKLVDEAGKPVQGSVSHTSEVITPDSIHTADDGVADFGLLPAGVQYLISVHLDGSGAHTAFTVLLTPNRAGEMKVVCPGEMPAVPLRFAIDPPESFAFETLYYLAQAHRKSLSFGGRDWSMPTSDAAQVFLLDSKGNILGEASPVDVGEDSDAGQSAGIGRFGVSRGPFGVRAPGGGGGMATEIFSGFVAEIPANLILRKANALPTGNYNVVLAAYRPNLRQQQDGDTRPPLVALLCQPLRRMFDLGSDGEAVCRIGSRDRSDVEFWRNLRGALATLETAAHPFVAPIPYNPQAFPPNSLVPVPPETAPPAATTPVPRYFPLTPNEPAQNAPATGQPADPVAEDPLPPAPEKTTPSPK